MTSLERLRLAGALGHSVAGAELRLRTASGEEIVVSCHPAADLDPCALRQVVISFACSNGADYSERIVDIDVGGAITDLGGGVFGVTDGDRDQRWIATLLTPNRVIDLLDDAGRGLVNDDALHACVKPDPNIGVTTVTITSTDRSSEEAIDEAAVDVAAACFIEELRSSIPGLANNVSPSPDG